VSAVVVVAAAALAAPHCEKPCKAHTAACMEARCAGLGAAERRACVETCRGIGGCAPIRTVAYVVTDVRADGQGSRQALRVRRGNCAPVTILELPLPTPPEQLSLDAALVPLYAQYRFGHFSTLIAFFQRLAVTPDGSGVVFEVTADAVWFPIFQFATTLEEGFYFVRADGTEAPRWIGPPSGVPLFVGYQDPTTPTGYNFGGYEAPATDISPDGRTAVFTDLGPGPAGESTVQVVTLDIATGKRTVVTHLPTAISRSPWTNVTEFPRFVDDDTILFVSYANPDGLNPDRYYMFFTVNVDGTALRAVGTPTVSATSRVLPTFSLSGGGTNLMNMAF
jgi:hypothetical protein